MGAFHQISDIYNKRDVEKLEKERRRKERDYFEKLSEVKRAASIISGILRTPYDGDRNYIVLGYKYMQLRVFSGENGYPIALVHDHSCREWMHGEPIFMTPGSRDNEVMRKSTNPKDIVDHLARIAGYEYPGRAEEIDNALSNMDAYEKAMRDRKEAVPDKSEFSLIGHILEGKNSSPNTDTRGIIRRVMDWLNRDV